MASTTEPNLIADALLHARPVLGARLLEHEVEHAGHDGRLVGAVAAEDDGDVAGMRDEVGAPGGRRARHVILGGEGKRVIDAIGITVHAGG